MASTDYEPDLVPELLVTDIARSVDFWCKLCGFEIDFDHPGEGFACINRGRAHVMLEQRGVGRNWLTQELCPPFGRGINFQIGVPDLEPIFAALENAKWRCLCSRKRSGTAWATGRKQGSGSSSRPIRTGT